MTQGTNSYAIHTGLGRVHLGDVLQLRVPPTVPTDAPDDTIYIFPKTNGRLYAVNEDGVEFDLTQGGTGGAGSLVTLGTAGEALALREVVFLRSDGRWYKLDIDAIPLLIGEQVGMVTASSGISLNNTGEITLYGTITGFTGLTIGLPVYASITPGQYTQSRPTVSIGGSQKGILPIGMALSGNEIFFFPRPLQIIKRDVLSPNETLTLQHPTDPLARRRTVRAFVSGGSASVGASYSQTYQDSDVELRKSGYSYDLTSGGTATAISYMAYYSPDRAFDNSTDYIDGLWIMNATTGWLKYDFGASNQRIITRYTLRGQSNAPARSPKNWTLEGSNDDTNWATLDTQTNQTSWAGMNTYTFTNTTAYRYYRLNITANNGDTYPMTCISEMELIGNADYSKLDQSFQVTGNQLLTQVRLWLKKIGSPTGTLTLRVETDNAGEASGTLVHANATTTFSEAQLGTSYGWVDFDFTSFTLTGATTYWLVLSTNRAASANDYIAWGADSTSPGYANGVMNVNSEGSWVFEGKDACFEVLVAETTYEEPCVVGRWSGGTRDIAVQFGDALGTNTDTHTTFKNVMGATTDVTAIVELV